MPNVFQNPDVLAAEAVTELLGQVQSGKYFNRNIERNFSAAPAKGTSVRIRYIPSGEASDLIADGTGTITSSSETYKEFTISEQPYQYREITSAEKSLEIEDFTAQVLKPMTKAIAKRIDSLALAEADRCVYMYPAVTPAAAPSTKADIFNVGVILDNLDVDEERVLLVTPTVYASLASVLTPVNESGSDVALRKGEIGYIDNTLVVKTTRFNSDAFTTGSAKTGVVNGAVATAGTSIVLDGIDAATGTIKAGDTLIISDANNVQHVRVSADATITSNAATVVVTEQLKYPIVDNAAVVFYDGGGNAHKTVGVMFTPQAFGLASISPDEIKSGYSASMDFDNFGLNLTIDGDAKTMKEGLMMSSFFGVKLLDEKQAVKIVVRV